MIDIIKQTPAVYSEQSRDYQVVARLYTILFNYSKMYIDNLNAWTSNIDNKLSMHRAKTLNFDVKHAWEYDTLDAITSCFKYLIRNKGTKIALDYCISILLRALNLNTNFNDSNIDIDDTNMQITIWADIDSVTFGAIDDLMAHLLPIGWTYRLIQFSESTPNNNISTELFYDNDSIKHGNVENSFRMLIGNDTNKKRFITQTFVYNDDDGEALTDSDESAEEN